MGSFNCCKYKRGEDGLPKIVEKEAETVRQIYRLLSFCLLREEAPQPTQVSMSKTVTIKATMDFNIKNLFNYLISKDQSGKCSGLIFCFIVSSHWISVP